VVQEFVSSCSLTEKMSSEAAKVVVLKSLLKKRKCVLKSLFKKRKCEE
jgi:hypothetical protein